MDITECVLTLAGWLVAFTAIGVVIVWLDRREQSRRPARRVGDPDSPARRVPHPRDRS
jgi:hypothetical protein